MLRTFFFTLLFTLKLFSCSGEATACQEKANDSKLFSTAHALSISLENSKRLLYSPTLPSYKLTRYDPFLGLALIEDKDPFPYPFVFYQGSSKKFTKIDKNGVSKGTFVSKQCGLDSLGRFSVGTKNASILTDECCAVSGMGTTRGVIDTPYLEHFLAAQSKIMIYGDVGIRIDSDKNRVYVRRVDPFFENQVFVVGDRILSFDKKKVHALCDLRRWILFSKIDSVHTFKILRKGKLLHVKTAVKKRLGGGLLSDTFLEHIGLLLNKKLCIEANNSKNRVMGLRAGDCLKQVNFSDVNSVEDIGVYLEKNVHDIALLFERKGFQFFIHINGKNGKITKKND